MSQTTSDVFNLKGMRVKMVRSHHLMSPGLIERKGQSGIIVAFWDDRVFVQFDGPIGPPHYNRYWLKHKYLEPVTP